MFGLEHDSMISPLSETVQRSNYRVLWTKYRNLFGLCGTMGETAILDNVSGGGKVVSR